MKSLLIPLLCLLAAPLPALQNQLQNHASPYLAMHGQDPVAWQDWGSAAVELARREGKLLFISSGYFSCHWCHVMQRESYRNADIAAILNEHFVPVKLDRELHGALDTYLIDFVDRTQGQAGWPLNVFLTPEGYPLIGTTYLPADRFRQLLERLNGNWQEEQGKLRNIARRATLQMMLDRAPAETEPLGTAALHELLMGQALAVADVMEGGFGNQSRFPMAPQLMALLELQAASPNPELAEFLNLTLDRMARDGLRDHLAGGFFRYTVDPSWQVPHFEKMLYTQAQLIEVFLRAAELFDRQDYAEVALDTVEFVLREMAATQGGYVSSFSAVDGDGEEGGVYLWNIDELHGLFGEDGTMLARRFWSMQDVPILDGGHLPRRGEEVAVLAEATGLSRDDVVQRIEEINTVMLVVRGQRSLPVDHKVLAGWNGLMLAAMVRAAERWQDPRIRSAATALRDYLRDRLWDGRQLRRAVAEGREIGRVSLEDYAYVAYGMAQYAELSDDPVDRTFVAALLNLAWQRYLGADGWRQDDRPLIPGMSTEPAISDGALPSPSAMLIRLALQSDDPRLVKKAIAAAELGRQLAQQKPFWYPGHYAALLSLPSLQP